MKRLGLVASCALAFAGPAAATPWVITPSGRPEAVFAGRSATEVAGLLAKGCAGEDLDVVSQSPPEVVCGDPKISVVRLAILQQGPDTKVMGRIEILEKTDQSSLARRIERGGDRVQKLLIGLGGAVPEGSHGGRPYLAVLGEDAGEGSWRVEQVEPAGPAARQGLKVGDLVTALDGKSFRNFRDFVTKLEDRKLGSAFTLTVVRDGATLDLPMTATGLIAP